MAQVDKNLARITEILKNKKSYISWTMRRYHLDYEKADNYFSEVLLKLLERDMDLTTINTQYIYSCINNIIIDQEIRRNKIQYYGDLKFAENLAGNRSLVVIYSYKNVREYIYSLSDNHKRYMIMKFAFGMLHKEIAEFLDKPIGTVAYVIMRAQNKLRDKVLNAKQ